MESLKLALLRIKALFTRDAIERDMDQEMSLHIDYLTEEYRQKGMSAEEARRAASRRFGNLTRLKEIGGEIRGGGILEATARDVRQALRGFRRTPGFIFTAVVMFALGIGANTAIFSIVDRLLLRPLPYADGEQLVMIREYRVQPDARMSVSPANFMDWQKLSNSFESITAWQSFRVALTDIGEPEQLRGMFASHEFFKTFRVALLLGRPVLPEDEGSGTPRVLLSHELWQRKFSGDPQIVGKTIQINATATEVVGVMPAGFRFMNEGIDIWSALNIDRGRDYRAGSGRFLSAIGRLKPDVTLETAQNEMAALAAHLGEIHKFNANSTFRLTSLRDELTGDVRTSLLVLFAAVGVLLMIACLNVTNLLLARSTARRQEFAIRVSLGAGRWALIRQLLAESFIIALAGGLAGVFVAQWGIALLVALAPENLLLGANVAIDNEVLLYTFGLSVLCGIVVGIVPAGSAARRLMNHIRDGSRTATRSIHLRQGLVIGQVALTVILLCGAGLLARSLAALNSVDTGVRTNDVLSLRIGLPGQRYTPPVRAAFYREAVRQIEALPGVHSVGAGVALPVSGVQVAGTGFHVLGEPELSELDAPSTIVRVVTADYFKTLGIPILAGREFTEADQTRDASLVFVVNESFAKRYLTKGEPLKASISVDMQAENPHSPVIGVVGDVKEGSLRAGAEPTVFYTYRHLPGNFAGAGMVLFIRSDRSAGLARQVTNIVRDMEKNALITEVQWLDEAFSATLSRERLNAVVSVAFGLSALLLSSLGIYGLLAFVVTERTREIGVRMALGAQRSTVLQMVLNHGLRMVAGGAVIGLVAALGLARFIESLLFGVTAYDPATLLACTVLLFVVAVFATLIPGRQATMVDPLVALRQD